MRRCWVLMLSGLVLLVSGSVKIALATVSLSNMTETQPYAKSIFIATAIFLMAIGLIEGFVGIMGAGHKSYPRKPKFYRMSGWIIVVMELLFLAFNFMNLGTISVYDFMVITVPALYLIGSYIYEKKNIEYLKSEGILIDKSRFLNPKSTGKG
jgi:hypothetical protein